MLNDTRNIFELVNEYGKQNACIAIWNDGCINKYFVSEKYVNLEKLIGFDFMINSDLECVKNNLHIISSGILTGKGEINFRASDMFNMDLLGDVLLISNQLLHKMH